MRPILPLAVLAALTVSTTLSAQQAEDHAILFNGTTDFVASSQHLSTVNTFTIDFWANPTATHDIDPESFAGYDGINGQQRYAVFPSHGTHLWGRGHAGAGISVGTNGVSVYEHAGDYIPAVLVHEAEISGWTHIALVYRDRTPSLYINGELVRTGRQSPMPFVHPSTGDNHPRRMISGFGGGPYGYYQGELDNVRVWSTGLADDLLATLPGSSDWKSEHLVLALDMNRSGAGDGLVVANAAAENQVVRTHGTVHTPVFTARTRGADERVDAFDATGERLSTPIEYVDTERTAGPTSGPTIK